jgi:pyruvate,orthophosphate dikinase
VTALAGQTVTVDGEHGKVYAGALEVVTPCETEDERLAELLAWAGSHSPLNVYRRSEAPDDALDLEGNDDAADPANLPALIRGARGARGGAIASEEGVRAALDAGLEYIVAEPTLPALLAAIQRSHAATNSPSTEND